MRNSFKSFIWPVCTLVLCATAYAEPTVPVRPTPTLPASGVLSQSAEGGYGAKKVDMPWGSDASRTDSASPIAGSVYKKGSRDWEAKVINNSTDAKYSASIKISQQGSSGGSVKSDYYSVTLNPGETDVRSFAAAANSTNATLELQSWKKLSTSKKP